MLFRNYIQSGPVLNRTYTYTFKPHELTLSYQVPYGTYGVVGNNGKNINYRIRPDKFDNDNGRNFYSLHSARFPYFYNRLIFSNFFPPEAGELEYEIGIKNLSEEKDKTTSLEAHLPEYLDDLLDGPTGINTQIREYRSKDDDEHLKSWLAIKPTEIRTINRGCKWLNFTIENHPRWYATHYYLISLNAEYLLSAEFTLYDR